VLLIFVIYIKNTPKKKVLSIKRNKRKKKKTNCSFV